MEQQSMFAALAGGLLPCGVCGTEKPRGEFHRNKSKPTGRQSVCKKCTSAQHKKRYSTDELRRDGCRIRSSEQWRRYHTDAEFRDEYLKKRRRRRRAEMKEGVSRVYFIRAGGFIKIGVTTNNVRERLHNLQVAHYEQLQVVGVMFAEPEAERELHRRFKVIHVRGEWFHAAPELMEFIREHAHPDE